MENQSTQQKNGCLGFLKIGCLGIIIFWIVSLVFSKMMIDSSNDILNSNDDNAIDITEETFNYRELCRLNDFEGAHKVLDALYAQYTSGQKKHLESDDDFYKRMRNYYTQYHDALEYIFNKEALYLFSLEDAQANKRITYLLTEIPIEGVKPNEGDHINREYQKFVSSFNSKCSQLLDLAIANNNKEIAKKLLSLYKDDVEETGQFGVSAKFTTKSKDAAKVKYKEAFGKD